MKNFNKIISNIKEKNILVIGDIMLDKYIFGDIERISPEAPVPVFKIIKDKVEYRLGGAGNVASNIVSLGAKCILIGDVGNDEDGKIIEKYLNNFNIKFSNTSLKGNKTICKTRYISNNQQVIRIDNEHFNNDNKNRNYKEFLNKIKFDEIDCIIISDYDKGLITKKLFEEIKKYNKKIIVDPKPKNINLYKDVYLITPNLKEATEITSVNDNIKANLLKLNKLTNSNVIVTMGRHGAAFYDKEEKKYFEFPATNKEVYDVSGAGDTFIAVLTLLISSKLDLEESIKNAIIAAGISVGKFGTSTVSLNELTSEINVIDNKIIHSSEILSFSKKIRLSQSIITTNGVFDILHTGHIKLLREAKKLGDVLIVCINSDSSTKQNKGKDRPFNNEIDRAELISNIKYVDYVTIFNEKTPTSILEKIKPNVHVKGDDYKIDEMPETKIVRENGGIVKTVKIVEDKSSSKLIEKLK